MDDVFLCDTTAVPEGLLVSPGTWVTDFPARAEVIAMTNGSCQAPFDKDTILPDALRAKSIGHLEANGPADSTSLTFPLAAEASLYAGGTAAFSSLGACDVCAAFLSSGSAQAVLAAGGCIRLVHHV